LWIDEKKTHTFSDDPINKVKCYFSLDSANKHVNTEILKNYYT